MSELDMRCFGEFINDRICDLCKNNKGSQYNDCKEQYENNKYEEAVSRLVEKYGNIGKYMCVDCEIEMKLIKTREVFDCIEAEYKCPQCKKTHKFVTDCYY